MQVCITSTAKQTCLSSKLDKSAPGEAPVRSLRAPQATWQALDELAARRGITRSELIRSLFEAAINAA